MLKPFYSKRRKGEHALNLILASFLIIISIRDKLTGILFDEGGVSCGGFIKKTAYLQLDHDMFLLSRIVICYLYWYKARKS
jgi:hypothetical protein